MNNTVLITFGNDTVNLKPDELTFANILENGYTLLDINESLCKYDMNSISDIDGSGSGNRNNNLNNYMNENLTDSLDDSLSNLLNNNLKNENEKEKETLDSLLF